MQDDLNLDDDNTATIPQCEDKWLTCKECSQDFLLEAGEQEFLHRLEAEGKKDQDGQPIIYREPKRCRECRMQRKARLNK